MRRTAILTTLTAALLTLSARPSAAQDPTPTTTATVTTPTAATRGTGLGVGGAFMLYGGLGGLSVAFDGGPWHLESILSLEKAGSGAEVQLGLGARFWFHLHSTGSSDFSVGGGVGYQNDTDGAADDDAVLNIDVGTQARAFIANNVAISATLGFSVLTLDANAFALTATPLLIAGFHYYFF
jgi:hypothetical protein